MRTHQAMSIAAWAAAVAGASFRFTTGVKVIPDVEPFKDAPGASR